MSPGPQGLFPLRQELPSARSTHVKKSVHWFALRYVCISMSIESSHGGRFWFQLLQNCNACVYSCVTICSKVSPFGVGQQRTTVTSVVPSDFTTGGLVQPL